MHVYLYICQTFNNNTCIICMHMCIDVCMYMCVFYISLSKDWNTERNPWHGLCSLLHCAKPAAKKKSRVTLNFEAGCHIGKLVHFSKPWHAAQFSPMHSMQLLMVMIANVFFFKAWARIVLSWGLVIYPCECWGAVFKVQLDHFVTFQSAAYTPLCH